MCAVTWALLAALVVARSAAQEPALRCRHERCRYLGPDRNNRTRYEVDDNGMTIIYKVNQLIMECNGASVLESPGLPRADPALRVTSVQLTGCPLPAAGSLADTLAALNLTLNCSEPGARAELSLTNLPPEPPLGTEHFARLECLVHLKIRGNRNTHPSLERGLFTSLRCLRWLVLGDVLLPTGELDLPPSVRQFDGFDKIEGMKRLLMTPTLEQFMMIGWTESRPAPLTDCEALRILKLVWPAMNALPSKLLANCSHLEVFEIQQAYHLTTLPSKLLVGASALTSFLLKLGALETLPAGLLDYSPKLRKLHLERNRLRTIPSGMFGVARGVQDINLSSNELDSIAMDALTPLEEVVELNFENNPRLGNVCGVDGYSPIRNSTKLKTLRLSETGVNQICRDWRQDMTRLEKLELSLKVSRLSFKDIQFTRTLKSEVVIYDSPMKVLETTREDYDNAARGLAGDGRVRFTYVMHRPELECDCRMYWTRRALDLSLPALEHFGLLRCTNGRPLRDVPPEDMVCARPEVCAAAELPAACTCSMWAAEPADDPDRDPRLVRVRCDRAELYSVPRPRDNSTERLYELQLAHNRIVDLHADDLQHNVKGIDLRNNFLREVDEETARRLGDIDGMLRLAGNPLECSCRATPLLRALHARNATQTDLSNATCNDGSPLEDTPIVECPSAKSPAALLNTWLVGGLAVLLALALAVLVSFASRERRFFLLAVLHRWGFLWCAAETEEEDGCRYDAFVTFSHKNVATVLEMIAKLEPPYQLCVHYRDWIPGCFISEQVVESVRESRRTVALVSRHFLASSWARAEFREAHEAAMLDARPRLIVVLLEELAALEMDEQLRRYVATHTYLRWGEPWFWDKLAMALPTPRAPRIPVAAPAAPLADHNLELSPAPT